jgi:hypothetical protein
VTGTFQTQERVADIKEWIADLSQELAMTAKNLLHRIFDQSGTDRI